MIEEDLENLRSKYQKTPIPNYLLESGWVELRAKIGGHRSFDWRLLFGRGLVFATVILSLLVGVTAVAQASKPTDALYPVKLATDEIVSILSGKPELKVGRRGQEIIDLSQDPDHKIDEATDQYKKTLEETKEEAKKAGKEAQFGRALDIQEEKLKEVLGNNPASAAKLQEAINQTNKTKGEIQGQQENPQDSNPGTDNRPDTNQNSQGRGQSPQN